MQHRFCSWHATAPFMWRRLSRAAVKALLHPRKIERAPATRLANIEAAFVLPRFLLRCAYGSGDPAAQKTFWERKECSIERLPAGHNIVSAGPESFFQIPRLMIGYQRGREHQTLMLISLSRRTGNCRFLARDKNAHVSEHELFAYFIHRSAIIARRRPRNDCLIAFDRSWQLGNIQVSQRSRMCVVILS